MLLVASLALAQDVVLRESLATGAGAATVYGGSFTGAGWRVDAEGARLGWDFGVQVERGRVSVVVDDVDWTNLLGDNNEFIELFDEGDKWTCTRAVTFRVYGDLEASSWGDVKLKTWDNTSALVSEARGGIQDWDGGPHTWTVTWDRAEATLSRDGVELVRLDVTGQDLRVGTLWLPLALWANGYTHPVGAVFSNLEVDAWLPAEGGGDDTGGGEVPAGERPPIQDVGVVESLGSGVYDVVTDLPVEGATEAAYLMFDLSDLSGVVTGATLTLRVSDDGSAAGDGATVYAVADTAWSEDTLSWASRPALGAAVGSFGAVGAGDVVEVDVTAGVRAGGRVALAVANGGGNGAHFWSREGAAPPSLRVTTAPGDTGGDGGGDTGADGGGDAGGGGGGGGGPDEDTAAGLPGKVSSASGCGCATGGAPTAAAWLVALLALGTARRRGEPARLTGTWGGTARRGSRHRGMP